MPFKEEVLRGNSEQWLETQRKTRNVSAFPLNTEKSSFILPKKILVYQFFSIGCCVFGIASKKKNKPTVA